MTVWKKLLLHKITKIVAYRTIISLINSMLSDRYFCLIQGNNISKQGKLNNRLPQGYVMTFTLFNLYERALTNTAARKIGYVDYLTLAIQH